MKKYVISFVILIIGLGLIGWKIYADKNINTSIVSIAEKDKAWEVLQKYLVFAKNQDLEGVKSLSYQISKECKDTPKDKSCTDRINTVYTFGINFLKEDFSQIWSDSKQIILATDYTVSTSTDATSRLRSIIYFTKDSDGNIKVLSFKPFQGTFVPTLQATSNKMSEGDVLAKLIKETEDKDQDGIEDFLETCSSQTSQDSSCIKTNPTKRDTDGDGWWDGVEILFYK